MESSLYIGATGMKAMSHGLNVVSNNLANVNTYGFKQQNLQYSDLISTAERHLGEGWETEQGSKNYISQMGHGVNVDSVRTFFEQGGVQGTNTVTDLAINGKGFFQVMDETSGTLYYSRTGDFIVDKEGWIRNPQGLNLMAWQLNEDGTQGGVAPIKMDVFEVMEPRATDRIELAMNLGITEDATTNEGSPYFALMQSYDGMAQPPIPRNAAGYQHGLTVHDAEGNTSTVTIYFDGAPSAGDGERDMEFVVAAPSGGESPGDGLLLSGVLRFAPDGTLTGVSAFRPSVAGSRSLEDWVPATMAEDGSILFDINGQNVALNLGISGGTAAEGAATAASVGTDGSLLGGIVEPELTADAITAFAGKTHVERTTDNGYASGRMSYYDIGTDGIITAYYGNGQRRDLWQIPIARFTSSDGLYRSGDNLYAATRDSGNMTLGIAGTENYGAIASYSLEISNVDVATEMVNMIVTQRGFQSNSKVVTTSDEMLRTAINLKR